MELWIIGILLCVAGSLVSSTGLILQKHSHNAGEGKLPLYCRWRWWIGFFFLVITGAALDGIALMFTPLSIVAPLSGLTIGTNSAMAMYFLEEKMNRMEVVATVVVLTGTVLTSAFGSHEAPRYNGAALLDLFQQWYMALYFPLVAVLALGSASTFLWKKCPAWLAALAVANLAGILGGNQNLFLKCTMELIKESLDGQNQWGVPTPYIMMVITLSLAIGQLWLMNLGLARHDAVSFLPGYQSALTVYGCIAGGVYFREFSKFSVVAWLFFPLGVALIIAGLRLLTHQASTIEIGPEDTISVEKAPLMSGEDSPERDEGAPAKDLHRMSVDSHSSQESESSFDDECNRI